MKKLSVSGLVALLILLIGAVLTTIYVRRSSAPDAPQLGQVDVTSTPWNGAITSAESAVASAKAEAAPVDAFASDAIAPSATSAAIAGPLARLAQLKTRFATGEIEAGRQLLTRVRSCNLRASIERITREESARDRPNPNTQMDNWRVYPTDPDCAGLVSVELPSEFDLLLRLAEQGDLLAQLEFVLDPPLDRRLAVVDLDRIFRYRERAPELLERAVAKGSVVALTALLDAHSPDHKKPEVGLTMTAMAPAPAPGANTDIFSRQARLGVSRSYRELPHRQTIRPQLALAYLYAQVCKRVCVHATWMAHADLAIADGLRELPSSERLRIDLEAQKLILDDFSPADVSAPANLTFGSRWNAQ